MSITGAKARRLQDVSFEKTPSNASAIENILLTCIYKKQVMASWLL